MLQSPSRTLSWMFCVVWVLLQASICSAIQEVHVGAMENGKQVELAKDEILSVTLESNPTTGYQWGVLKLDAAILRQIGEPEYTPDVPPTSGISGRGGRETFRFQAAGPGYGCLILGYRRPWEKEVEPIKTYTVQVLVR